MSIPINFSMTDKKDSKTEDKKEEKKEPKTKICFIADFQMSEDLKNMLRSFSVPFVEAEMNLDLLFNKSFAELKDVGVVWVNMTSTNARNWVAANLDRPANYALITVYKTKSEYNQWVEQLADVSDNVISKSVLKTIKSLSFEELINKALSVYKIATPKSRCTKIMSFLLKKFGL